MIDQFGRDTDKFIYHKSGQYKGPYVYCDSSMVPEKGVFTTFHWHRVNCPDCLIFAPKKIKECATCRS